MTAIIQFDHVVKSFGDLRAVDDLHMVIHEGQSFGLVGPNGAGKTTTIKMIVGTLAADSGDIVVNGLPAGNPEARRQIGIAPQSLALYDELTAKENLHFFGSLFSLPRQLRNERVALALDLAQLENRADEPVANFSGGMKRRLNLAAAIIHDPNVLLLDEPTVGVDPQSRNHIFDCIERLHAEGRTIVYTSHYMEEVERLCDEIAIMDHGRLLANDSLDGLLAKHATTSSVIARLSAEAPPEVQLPGAVENGVWTFDSEEPFEIIAQATQAGVPLTSLQVSRPNLENVFLHLTGRRLRD